MITLEKIDNIAFDWNKNGILYNGDFNDLCEAARRGVEADHELQNAFEDAVTRAERAEAELAAIKAALIEFHAAYKAGGWATDGIEERHAEALRDVREEE